MINDPNPPTLIALFTFIFSVIKIMIIPQARTLKQTGISIFIALPMGFLAGMVSLEHGVTQWVAVLIASVFALIGENVVLAIINNKEYIDRIIKNRIDKATK